MLVVVSKQPDAATSVLGKPTMSPNLTTFNNSFLNPYLQCRGFMPHLILSLQLMLFKN